MFRSFVVVFALLAWFGLLVAAASLRGSDDLALRQKRDVFGISSGSSGIFGPSTSHSSNGFPAALLHPHKYLSLHNAARQEAGAANLTWSFELAMAAQEWANGCQLKHSAGQLGPFGENLAAGTGDFTVADAIGLWTAEKGEYNPSTPTASHYTQVVWKGTTEVGCAVASCDSMFDPSFGPAQYIVCEYSPAGNVVGQFLENVDA